jgi:predicted acetyltransferase
VELPSLELVRPAVLHLPGFVHALRSGWSPDNVRPEAAAAEALAQIERDAAAFLAGLVDREANGPPIQLADGRTAPRLPGFTYWLWDGEFCGSIGLRWQAGSGGALPPHVPGHIGYAVVPWKRGRGYATRALALLLPLARAEGLPYVLLNTLADNEISQRVIRANGGELIERFADLHHHGAPSLRFRIALVDTDR